MENNGYYYYWLEPKYMKELDNQIQQYFSHLENNNHEQIHEQIQRMR